MSEDTEWFAQHEDLHFIHSVVWQIPRSTTKRVFLQYHEYGMGEAIHKYNDRAHALRFTAYSIWFGGLVASVVYWPLLTLVLGTWIVYGLLTTRKAFQNVEVLGWALFLLAVSDFAKMGGYFNGLFSYYSRV